MWMATEIHLDHSSPLRKQWSPFHQVSFGNKETSSRSKSWCVACLAGEVVMLSLLKVVMNLLLEGLDLFNQYSCMIYLSVGGIFRWRCNMKRMKGYVINLLDWPVWRHPRRCNKNILVLFYNLVDMLLLYRKVLGWSCSGCSVLFLSLWLYCEEDELFNMRYYFVALFWWDNSRNYLWYPI